MARAPAPVDRPKKLKGKVHWLASTRLRVKTMEQDLDLLMARVPHDKADVVHLRKQDSCLDVGGGGDVDRVPDIVAKLARRRLRRKGVTTLVGKERLHHRGGRVQAKQGGREGMSVTCDFGTPRRNELTV